MTEQEAQALRQYIHERAPGLVDAAPVIKQLRELGARFAELARPATTVPAKPRAVNKTHPPAKGVDVARASEPAEDDLLVKRLSAQPMTLLDRFAPRRW